MSERSLQLLLLTLLLFSGPQAAAELPAERVSLLRETLTARVLGQYPAAEVSISFKNTSTVKRTCTAPSTQVTAQQVVGRIPVRVRCQGKTPWSYYTYAEVTARQALVVAAHPISRGSTIGALDLQIQSAPVDPHNSYFAHKKSIIGRLAARNIRAGDAIQARQLRYPLAVKRGDRVTIQARHGQAVISTQGTAMQSGHIGEQIPVKNNASQRVIHTWIVAKGLVNTRAVRT